MIDGVSHQTIVSAEQSLCDVTSGTYSMRRVILISKQSIWDETGIGV